MANLGIDFDELANELLEVAKLNNFAFGLFLSGRGRKGLAYRLAIYLVGQARVGTMHRLTGLVAVAISYTAAAAGMGDGATAQIAQSGELLGKVGAARFQILDRVVHRGGLLYPSVLHTYGLMAQKKENGFMATFMSRTRFQSSACSSRTAGSANRRVGSSHSAVSGFAPCPNTHRRRHWNCLDSPDAARDAVVHPVQRDRRCAGDTERI